MTQINVLGATMTLAVTKDRWYNKPFYLKHPVPWLGNILALSEPQKRAIAAFSVASHALAGINRWQRREGIANALRGQSYGGAPRPEKKPKIPESELKGRIGSARGAASGMVGKAGMTALAEATRIVYG